MTKTYEGSVPDRILKLIKSCPLPDGATHTWLCEQSGASPILVTAALGRLTRQYGLAVSFKIDGWVKYFPNQEAVEAAMPALEAFKAEVKARQLRLAREKYARIDPEKRRAKNARRAENRRKQLALEAKPPKAAKEPKPAKVLKAKKPRVYKPGPQIVFAQPVSVAPKKAGPARLPGEPVITPNTRITIAPPPPERVYRTSTHSVLP